MLKLLIYEMLQLHWYTA